MSHNRKSYSCYVVIKKVEQNFLLFNINKKETLKVEKKFIFSPISFQVGDLFSAKLTENGLQNIKIKTNFAQIQFRSFEGSCRADNVIVKVEKHEDSFCFYSDIVGRIKICNNSQIHSVRPNQLINISIQWLNENEKYGIFKESNWREVEKPNQISPTSSVFGNRFDIVEEFGLIVKIESGRPTIWNENLYPNQYKIQLLGGDNFKLGDWIKMKFPKLEHSLFFSTNFEHQNALNIYCSQFQIISDDNLPSVKVIDSEVHIDELVETDSQHEAGNPIFHHFFGVLADSEKLITEKNCIYKIVIKFDVNIHKAVVSSWKIICVTSTTKKKFRRRSPVSKMLLKNQSVPPSTNCNLKEENVQRIENEKNDCLPVNVDDFSSKSFDKKKKPNNKKFQFRSRKKSAENFEKPTLINHV